ncbi:MAG: AbrB/MazE/SpoVT family DNA-binding domain-containing protein [Nanoarchaeota archaeon]|nr:AbrB/MazE/SpoVT family DNA-binding domain-containing protein [Nanoarchaeota archaeon]
MELAITKMSANGQVVIPSGIREGCRISPATKFLVFSKGRDILLKRIDERNLEEDMDLVLSIERSEEDIKNGKFVSVNSEVNVNEIDLLLLGE